MMSGVELVPAQEHVTEYGVHWSFFVTLGLLPLLAVFAERLYPRFTFTFLGFVIALGACVHAISLMKEAD